MSQAQVRYPIVRGYNQVLQPIQHYMDTERQTLLDIKVNPVDVTSSFQDDTAIMRNSLCVEFTKKDFYADFMKMPFLTQVVIHTVNNVLKKDLHVPSFQDASEVLKNNFAIIQDNHLPSAGFTHALEDQGAMSSSGKPTPTIEQLLKAKIHDCFKKLQLDGALENFHFDAQLVHLARFLTTKATENLWDIKLSGIENKKKKLMNISVLRYPDFENQVWTLYNMSCYATRTVSQNLKKFGTKTKNQLDFTIHKETFNPYTDVLKPFPHKVLQGAANKAAEFYKLTEKHNPNT